MSISGLVSPAGLRVRGTDLRVRIAITPLDVLQPVDIALALLLSARSDLVAAGDLRPLRS